ncbi:G-protein coupled receptor moody [Schistocerca cancellata]|uniref:G-protein coupled receptor moody n=1 Tax=Schistocerca cancellata TaxID=274614 RepID=UPI0021186A43|nr:G-protein coupled receptor moody [Schistocerca cancellata]XP_049768743.1 G-protein coupled receptor moody [Schistocerca cancellata]
MEMSSAWSERPPELTMALVSGLQQDGDSALGDDSAGSVNATLAPPSFPRPLLTFAAVATITILVVGVLGNLLTVVALLRCPRVRNVAAAFIISLCVADLVFCALVLPFSASRFVSGTWVHGDQLCQLFPLMRYGNVGVSLLSIAMITINRYIMIAHHGWYGRIYRRHWIAAMIAFCWLFSYGMQLPTLLGVWGRFGYDALLGSCSILEDSSGRSSKTALFVLGFLVPCVVIVACYARIFWVVHESENRMRSHQSAAQAPTPGGGGKGLTPGGGAGGGGGGQQQRHAARDVRARRNEWRITKMVLAIFLSFVVCYLPITIVKVADHRVRHPGLHVLGYIMLYLSACLNPIIYVIMNKQYRQAYKTVLLLRRPRLLSLTPTANNSSCQDKSKDAISRTMVSQVSIAMGPMVPHRNDRNDELPEVFEEP